MHEQDKITFTVIEEGIAQLVQVQKNEYCNLMALLNDRFFLDYFGECGGQGRCATCMVWVKGNDDIRVSNRNSNEYNTLQKYCRENEPCRLACQISIDKLLNDVFIYLTEDDY